MSVFDDMDGEIASLYTAADVAIQAIKDIQAVQSAVEDCNV